MVRNIDLNFPPVESIEYPEPENIYRACQQQVSYVPPSSATNVELTENEVVILSSSGSLPMGLLVPPSFDEASVDPIDEKNTTGVCRELPSKPSPTPVSCSPEKATLPKRKHKKRKLTLAPSPMRQVIPGQSAPSQEDI
ncbi:hypothetical protein ZIOFF_012170 [Zingiber officinale]|uniref:Uncharacterized protein n=1 Tax=Zingiber officinale TaxID=94328 RepID=A0A8J5LTR1_ZINOF|nr:hypothetical protein ZIOFF_016117 [Zingiber officinale]KAG6529953.1 hypothetical protein ZIOFF_012170 [Zingiber officinale]